jgi:signal transduction histidine kinase
VRARQGVRDVVVLHVADQGPGIALEARDHVFEPFVRAPSQTDDSSAGLGLAIVRGLVEAHGGRVWIDEAEGHGGTCIAVALPAAGGD